MRREEQDAVAALPGGFDQLPAGDLRHQADHLGFRPRPQPGQFQHAAAGVGHGGRQDGRGFVRVIGQRQIFLQVAPIGGRGEVGNPAEEGTEAMQQAKR